MAFDAPPQPAIPPTKIPTSRSAETAFEREVKACCASIVRNQVNSKQRTANAASGIGATRQSVSRIVVTGNAAEALPVVVILVVKETGFDEATLIAVGENAQDVAKGKPEHDIEMFPLKPVPGLICREYCAVWPATIAAVVEDCGEGFN